MHSKVFLKLALTLGTGTWAIFKGDDGPVSLAAAAEK